jgi:hypothetical protein
MLGMIPILMIRAWSSGCWIESQHPVKNQHWELKEENTDNYLSVLDPQPLVNVAHIAASAKNGFKSVDRCSIGSISNCVYIHLEPGLVPLSKISLRLRGTGYART